MISTSQVQTILRSVILSGLAKYGHEGWECIEFANFGKVRMDNIVTMNLLRRKRVGWQARRYGTLGEEFQRTDEWLSEEHWQLQIIKKRTDNDESEESALDIAEVLVSWFNGAGCDELRSHRIANLRIDAEQIIVYNDDSDLYQKRAVFTVKLQVPKELTIGQDVVDVMIPSIKPI